MKPIKRVLTSLTFIVLFFIFHQLEPAFSNETLTWIQHDWPPAWINEGDEKGNGALDLLERMLKSRLPQYDHFQKKMNWSRAFHEIKAGGKLVHPAAFKTKERLEYCLFSEPLYVSPTVRIIMRKTTIEELGYPRSLPLARLLKDDRLAGFVQINRSFDEKIDSVIAAYAADSNLSSVVMDMDHIIALLMYDRIDYTIEYSLIARYIEKTHHGKTGFLGSLTIEGFPEWIYAYAACPKNAWGRQVIDDINRVVREIKSTPEYLQNNKSWFPPEDQALIDQVYQSDFLKQK